MNLINIYRDEKPVKVHYKVHNYNLFQEYILYNKKELYQICPFSYISPIYMPQLKTQKNKDFHSKFH